MSLMIFGRMFYLRMLPLSIVLLAGHLQASTMSFAVHSAHYEGNINYFNSLITITPVIHKSTTMLSEWSCKSNGNIYSDNMTGQGFINIVLSSTCYNRDGRDWARWNT